MRISGEDRCVTRSALKSLHMRQAVAVDRVLMAEGNCVKLLFDYDAVFASVRPSSR